MTVIKTEDSPEVDETANALKEAQVPAEGNGQDDGDGKDSMFSGKNISEDSQVEAGQAVPKKDLDLGKMQRNITITAADKKRFVDAVVANSRYTRDYALFGGRVTLTVRSLTADESSALATWTAKMGTSDSAGMFAGRYRKYLMAAQLSRLDGVDMPPLETPLFETLAEDGKTVVPPGWVKRCDYFDSMGIGKFNAIMGCLADFDLIYSTLCQNAEDANFWNPDTP